MEVIGIPSTDVLKVSQRKKKFFSDDNVPMLVPNSRGKIKKPGNKNLEDILECEDPNFVNFIEVIFIHLNTYIEMFRLEP